MLVAVRPSMQTISLVCIVLCCFVWCGVQELLRKVKQIVEMPENDCLPLDEAAKRCNAKLLNHTDHLIAFAFHDSKTIIQTAQDAKTQTMLVVILFLD